MNVSGLISVLKELKNSRGLTNEALAERSGVSLGTVNKLFSGKTASIKVDTLFSLAAALGVPPETLLASAAAPQPVLPPAQENHADNFGFVKVGVDSPEVRVADVAFNAGAIVSAAERAAAAGVKILCLPELSLTGYTCGDLFYQPALLSAAENYAAAVAERTARLGLLLFFGAPLRKDGRIYNCAVACLGGEILLAVPKTYLPNYNEFYEARQFEPAPQSNSTINIAGKNYPFGTKYIIRNTKMPEMTVGAELCEDLWVASPPSTALALAGATVIVNLSCSDETVGKAEYRRSLVSMQSAKTYTAYLYANAGEGESTTDTVYSGHSIIADNGRIVAESQPFGQHGAYADVDLGLVMYDRSKSGRHADGGFEYIDVGLDVPLCNFQKTYSATPFVPTGDDELKKRSTLIIEMQAHALKKRLCHIGAKDVVIGVSGGLDSTLALLVCARAFDLMGLDRSGIHAITMPCFGTTSRTYNNAVSLSRLLGCSLEKVDIKKSVLRHFEDIGHDPSVTDVTYENSQARERTQVLMDLSNKYNGIVIGTGDLSELALGWATYNGDHMSMYAVNASIPKTLIRYIIASVGGRYGLSVKAVLWDILQTPVSPELLPHDHDKIVQKTEDTVGPYELHDFFLYHALRSGFKPSKIFFIARRTFPAYDDGTIYKWLKTFYKRFFSQQFKRSCLPDGVKIGSVALSPRGDWRMPSDACAAVWLDDLKEIENSLQSPAGPAPKTAKNSVNNAPQSSENNGKAATERAEEGAENTDESVPAKANKRGRKPSAQKPKKPR